MDDWQQTPSGAAGEFHWQHVVATTRPMLTVKHIDSRDSGALYLDAEQLCFLLRQLADKHGVEETLKWLPKS